MLWMYISIAQIADICFLRNVTSQNSLMKHQTQWQDRHIQHPRFLEQFLVH